MRVFVTGGTGLIGSAVVAELIGNGHTVLALVRSDASALAAEAAGAQPLRGALADPDVLRAGVAQADGVIHLAFANDFTSPEALAKAVAEESAALATLGEELVGSDRPFVTVSGTPQAPGRASTEADPEKMRRFAYFVNAPTTADPSLAYVAERGQPRPATRDERADPAVLIAGTTLAVRS